MAVKKFRRGETTYTCSSCKKLLGKKAAKGLCRNCYQKAYKKAHPERLLRLQRAYYQRNKVAFLERIKIARKKRRAAMIQTLGGECACCGEKEPLFLCLDHIKGGGRCEYKKKGGPHGVWRRAIREGLPRDKYRVLCWNCNAVLGLYGRCPHGKLTSPIYQPKQSGSSE